jgi:hypothetical protein
MYSYNANLPGHTITDVEYMINELTDEYPKAQQPKNAKLPLKPHQLTILKKCEELESKKMEILPHIRKLKDKCNSMDIPYPYTLRNNLFDPNIDLNKYDGFIAPKIGIIADKAASGKSFIILAMILKDINNRKTVDTVEDPIEIRNNYNISTHSKCMFTIYMKDNYKFINTNVIIVHSGTYEQWKKSVEMYSDSIKYIFIETIDQLTDLAKQVNLLTQYHIVFLLYKFHNKFANMLSINNICVNRIIYDDFEILNIPTSLEIKSQMYWFVTAAYKNIIYPTGRQILNRDTLRYEVDIKGIKNSGFLKELFRDMFYNIENNIYTMIVFKNTDEYVTQSFNIIEPQLNYIRCKERLHTHALNGIVDKRIIDFLNNDDVESAIKIVDVRQKNSKDNIIDIIIERYKYEIKQLSAKIDSVNRIPYRHEEEKEATIMKLTKTKDELLHKVANIIERIEHAEKCGICFEDLDKKTIVKCCQNMFCFKCIHIWINRRSNCPICKNNVYSGDLFIVNDDNDEQIIDKTESNIIDPNEINENHNKTTNFINLLRNLMTISDNVNDKRVLVFSHSKGTYDRITAIFKSNAYNYCDLKGNNKQISNKLKKYKDGKINILLTNSSYYGCGLNLEDTTDIIMLHKPGKELEDQILGRCLRPNRTKQLNIWYILYENEMIPSSSSSS